MMPLQLRCENQPPRSVASVVDETTLAQSSAIVGAVRAGGLEVLLNYAVQFGDVSLGAPYRYSRTELEAALNTLPEETRGVLERACQRIERFARCQRAAILDIEQAVPGGSSGLRYQPVRRAGCYAPGGRFPLPSSVLMTVCTARAAGVGEVWVASPRPQLITLAAAALAGADGLLAVGGAQAVAAMAYGVEGIPACDIIVGPGNRWVTAAKKCVAGDVAIDMLAGPSELLLIADDSACPQRIAADLLAQAEHDPDAMPALIALDPTLPKRVNASLTQQLASLPTREIALEALRNGWYCVSDVDEAVRLANEMAPEHLSVQVKDTIGLCKRLTEYGALFMGDAAAEVLGDYGAGPNHTLPTGGSARSFGALSVMDFLRAQTWLRIDHPEASEPLVRDTVSLARLEGLEAHARSAELRAVAR